MDRTEETMAEQELGLIAHLMRRAGFGAPRDELEALAARGYEATLDDLLNPERFPEVEDDLLTRYYTGEGVDVSASQWIYRMVNSQRPLEEKTALFWHHVFATAIPMEHPPSSYGQIETFRRVGLSDMGTILTALSRDPAMIFWLDNNENHNGEPNENYGRELLELFSMGVGNYTEDDIKMAARAFTGWTFKQPLPLYPHGHYPAAFTYVEDDHDDSVKTFLGETGRFNGDDIVRIIVKQRATATFVSRHLYNFFVADEAQVPAWSVTAPRDPDAIESLVQTYMESGGEIRSVLRVLFSSDFFKEARFQRVKCPTELVTGVLKLVGTYRSPEAGISAYWQSASVMGQELLNPPTVEGWHTGREWIDGGTLNERVNFAVNEVADAGKPGIRALVDRLKAEGPSISEDRFVDRCLDLLGPVEAGDETRRALLRYAESGGALELGDEADQQESTARIVRMAQLIVASREYQFA
jgi:uncharacterized protein (DUF1800 family)